MAGTTRGAKGRAARNGGRVDVCARVHEQPTDVKVPRLCSLEEGRRAVLLAQVDISFVVEEEACNGELAYLARDHPSGERPNLFGSTRASMIRWAASR